MVMGHGRDFHGNEVVSRVRCEALEKLRAADTLRNFAHTEALLRNRLEGLQLLA